MHGTTNVDVLQVEKTFAQKRTTKIESTTNNMAIGN